MADLGNTQYFKVKSGPELNVKDVLSTVYTAMAEKGYNPVNQIVGYIMSGDPTYITSYKGARSMIMKVERDEIVEELLRAYIRNKSWPLGLTAQGVEIIRRQKENHLRKTYQRIKELCEQYDVEKIVLGLPLNMDDTMGDRAEKTLEFKNELERRLSVPVLLVDERLTTVEAIEIMDDAGIKVSEREKYVDMIAATIILQDYMNSTEGK